MTDRIVLTGLVFEGRHGYPDEERATPQPIEVDVALTLDLAAAGDSDDLDQSVDYSAVARLVGTVVRERSFRLIEAIAQAIARDVLTLDDRIEAVEVRVQKPRIQLGDGAGRAAVEIRRQR